MALKLYGTLGLNLLILIIFLATGINTDHLFRFLPFSQVPGSQYSTTNCGYLCRSNFASHYDIGSDVLYVFSGLKQGIALDQEVEILSFSFTTNLWTQLYYGGLDLVTGSFVPPYRPPWLQFASMTKKGNSLYIFGGLDVSNSVASSRLWELNIPTGAMTMTGSQIVNDNLGTPWPGGRYKSIRWKDVPGNIHIVGGRKFTAQDHGFARAWRFSGNAWSYVNIAAPYPALTYDKTNLANWQYSDDLTRVYILDANFAIWSYNFGDAGWTYVSIAGPPSGPAFRTAVSTSSPVFDPTHTTATYGLYGGYTDTVPNARSDLWVLNAGIWQFEGDYGAIPTAYWPGAYYAGVQFVRDTGVGHQLYIYGGQTSAAPLTLLGAGFFSIQISGDWYCGAYLNTDLVNACGGIEKGTCVDVNTCECNEPQYTESGGTCVSSCADPDMCEHFGVCAYDVCTCPTEEWLSPFCNVTECFGILSNDSSVCSRHGDCVSQDICVCDPEWVGSQNCSVGTYFLQCSIAEQYVSLNCSADLLNCSALPYSISEANCSAQQILDFCSADPGVSVLNCSSPAQSFLEANCSAQQIIDFCSSDPNVPVLNCSSMTQSFMEANCSLDQLEDLCNTSVVDLLTCSNAWSFMEDHCIIVTNGTLCNDTCEEVSLLNCSTATEYIKQANCSVEDLVSICNDTIWQIRENCTLLSEYLVSGNCTEDKDPDPNHRILSEQCSLSTMPGYLAAFTVIGILTVGTILTFVAMTILGMCIYWCSFPWKWSFVLKMPLLKRKYYIARVPLEE